MDWILNNLKPILRIKLVKSFIALPILLVPYFPFLIAEKEECFVSGG
jgi:hypothetical protein